jgi:hypothetical protein
MTSNAFSKGVAAPRVECRHAGLTLRSTPVRALLAITFIYPVALCAIFFPTPASDLREHINLGLTFPLYTWANPPLQSWIAGLIALTGARDAWLYVLAAQVLNFVGLAYLVRSAKKFIGVDAAVPLAIMYCGSLYYSAATPSMALNADQIQVPIWAGVLYHALSAAQDNRWRDWLLAGFLVSLGFLAKYYSAVILVTLLATALWLPAYRGIFVNVRFYIAGVLAVAIISVNMVPELLKTDVLEFGVTRFSPAASLTARASAVWQLMRSYVFYAAPALIGFAVLVSRGCVGRPRLPADPARRFLVISGIGLPIVMLLLIVIGGLLYMTRYTYAFYGLSLLAFQCVIRIEPRALRDYANVTLAIWAAIIVGTLAYTQIVIHRVFRDPAPAAAAMLREVWDRQFSCGPSYILGTDRAAHGIAIYFGRPVIGVAFDEVGRTNWFDRDRLERLGAVVVSTPDQLNEEEFAQWFAGNSLASFSLPYRRTLQPAQQTFQYYLIPPRSCKIESP